MTEINHFIFFIFSDDVMMTKQLMWIAHILGELSKADSFI
jgi:hypothetical protein